MDVATIEMPIAEAKAALKDYESALRQRHDDELAEVMVGLKQLVKGNALVKLSDSIRDAGVDDEGMPRLAICRADEKWCRVDMRGDGSATFRGYKDEGWQGDVNHSSRLRRVRVAPDSFPRFDGWRHIASERRAVVPLVPPPYRPKFALSNYHVLWEAEWEPFPPRDPMLLKRISGDLFAVVAQWDLTDLERAVLGGRFNE